MSKLDRLWNLAFNAELPDNLENPIQPLWEVTFGVGAAPEDALKKLSDAYGIDADEEAAAPKARTKKAPAASAS